MEQTLLRSHVKLYLGDKLDRNSLQFTDQSFKGDSAKDQIHVTQLSAIRESENEEQSGLLADERPSLESSQSRIVTYKKNRLNATTTKFQST